MGKHGQTGPTRADRPQSPQRQQRPRHSEGRVGSPPASGSCRRASEERGSGPEAPTGRAGGGARAGVGQPPNPHARCFPELLSRSWGRLAGRACLGARNLVWRPGCFGPSSSSRLPKLTHDRGSISRCSGGVRTPGRTGAKPAIPIDSSSTDTHDEIPCLSHHRVGRRHRGRGDSQWPWSGGASRRASCSWRSPSCSRAPRAPGPLCPRRRAGLPRPSRRYVPTPPHSPMHTGPSPVAGRGVRNKRPPPPAPIPRLVYAY